MTYLGRPPQELVDARRAARMTKIDGLPEDWRELVHEFGFCVIDAIRSCGVEKSKHAKHIIRTVLEELSPIGGSFSSQGESRSVAMCMVLVPQEPTDRMIEASMATVSGFDVSCSKHEKHRRRLKAAIAAAREGRA